MVVLGVHMSNFSQTVFPLKFSICLFLFGFVLGCGSDGPQLSTVTGKVTKGGKPLASVSVTFTPVGGGIPSAGLTDGEGKFALLSSTGKAGALVGKHKVVLASKASESAPVGYEAMMKARQSSEGGNRGAPKEQPKQTTFPPEYGDASKTPLEYEVKPGSNDFDIVIP